MFGNKKNDSFSGNEKQNAPGSGDKEKKFTGSLEKIEGKKEKLSKLLKRKKKDEEPVSLYEPEMEYVTAEELQKEEKERVNAAEQKEGGGTDSGRQDGAQTTGGKEQKIGKDSGVRTRFKNLFSKKDEAAQKTGTAGPQSTLFDDEPILYDIDDEKGLRKLSKKKLAVIAGAVVIVLGAASYFIFTNLGGSVDGTAYVESVKDIMSYGSGSGMNNRYTGEVEPQDSWDITLQSDLSVDECYVKAGDQVKEGDKLFSYNTEEMTLAKERAQLEVETLKNENSELQQNIKTYQNDLKSASTRERIELQTEILTAQTTIKKNEYSIDSANDEIDDLNKNIKDATVTSKMDGVVQSINEEVGMGSGSDDSDDEDSYDYSDTGDDSTYMTIVAVGDYRVKGSVSETNVWSLTEGDPVIIRSRVDDTAKWTGVISSINTDETEDSDESSDDMDYYMDDSSSGESASTYNFYVELDSDDGLMMGQHVFIEQDFGQDEEREGIWLPSAYIYMDEDKYYVWRANRRDRLELHEVTVGEYDEDLDEYQILDGLDEDDYIASDTGSLQENMKTTTDISEADTTDEYYEEETSDDDLYYDEGDGDEYYDDESSDDEMYEDSYEDDGLGDDIDLIDEGFDPAEFE
ncbi:MAG TPA: efflux RND transporter periplasmic adaptor subunit [Candidatus Anaerobutyricum faecale]|nr:efflux RND transporter periplasmic adaptor subunit [Candidatus Anaerobutyricum faecale]